MLTTYCKPIKTQLETDVQWVSRIKNLLETNGESFCLITNINNLLTKLLKTHHTTINKHTKCSNTIKKINKRQTHY